MICYGNVSISLPYYAGVFLLQSTPSASQWDETPGRAKGSETPGATPSTRLWESTPGHATPGATTPGHGTPGGKKNRWDETPKTDRGRF